MVNISVSIKPEKYKKLYEQFEKRSVNEKISMSDIINEYIQRGLAYEALLNAQKEQNHVPKVPRIENQTH